MYTCVQGQVCPDLQTWGGGPWFDSHAGHCHQGLRVCPWRAGSHQDSGFPEWWSVVWILYLTRGNWMNSKYALIRLIHTNANIFCWNIFFFYLTARPFVHTEQPAFGEITDLFLLSLGTFVNPLMRSPWNDVYVCVCGVLAVFRCALVSQILLCATTCLIISSQILRYVVSLIATVATWHFLPHCFLQ